MLILSLFRHAKSSWADLRLDDFDRPLNERGKSAAPRMGKIIAGLEPRPDLVLCSAAVRTRQTLSLAETTSGSFADQTRFEKDLYLASSSEMLARLKDVGDDIHHILLVGHNPGMQTLACDLAHTGEARSIVRLEEKFPTAALAVFSFPFNRWAELETHTGRLERFITPRECA